MFWILLGALLAERLVELVLAARNRRWALARGGVETGAAHYPAIVALHASFYAALTLEWIFVSPGWSPLWPLWLALLATAQAVRFWAIRSLGSLWNTRVIVIPGMRPVRHGPYRFVRHPNYVVVAVEIAVISLLASAYWTAAIFSVLNGLVLRVRIREEERALARLAPDSAGLPRFLPRWRAGA